MLYSSMTCAYRCCHASCVPFLECKRPAKPMMVGGDNPFTPRPHRQPRADAEYEDSPGRKQNATRLYTECYNLNYKCTQ